jgi:hypothetical protein
MVERVVPIHVYRSSSAVTLKQVTQLLQTCMKELLAQVRPFSMVSLMMMMMMMMMIAISIVMMMMIMMLMMMTMTTTTTAVFCDSVDDDGYDRYPNSAFVNFALIYNVFQEHNELYESAESFPPSIFVTL